MTIENFKELLRNFFCRGTHFLDSFERTLTNLKLKMEFVGAALIDALLRHNRNTGITLVRKRITAA